MTNDWRGEVKATADRLKLAAVLGMVVEYDADSARWLADLLTDMADRLDAIKVDASAMAALKVGFRG